MNLVLNEAKMRSTVDEQDGLLDVGLANSKMLLELARAESAFLGFVAFLDDMDEAKRLGERFERLRDKCLSVAFRQVME